jgi:hypothetical protein
MTTTARTSVERRSHAPTVVLRECPKCGGSDSIAKIILPAVGQTALIPLCDCWSAELRIDGDEAKHKPAHELADFVRERLVSSPGDLSGLRRQLTAWWDLLRPEPVSDTERVIHRAALEYLRRGYALIPLHGVQEGACTCRKGTACRSPGKHPIRKDWTKRAIRSPIELARLFRTRDGRPTNLGIFLDPKLRLLLLDIDAKSGKDGPRTIQTWAGDLGVDFDKYRIQDTPSGGWHVLFRLPEAFEGPLPNRFDVAPGVDVFHHERQFVVSPSQTEKGRYVGVGSETVILPRIDELPEAPKQVLDFLSSQAGRRGGLVGPRDGAPDSADRAVQGPSIDAVRALVAQTPNPETANYDDYMRMAHYIKGACGPEYESEAREMFHEWADRWEGGVNDPETNDELLASIRWTGLRSGWPQLLRAATAFGADTEAIEGAKRAEAQEEFAFAVVDAEDTDEAATMGDWERPTPIVREDSIESFPVDTLPSVFRRYVESVAQTLEVPIDVPAINVLGAIAGAAQRSLDGIRVHEDYLEPIGLFLACQLHSGEGKTAVVNEFRRPFENAQQILREKARPQRAETEAQRELLVREKKVLERQIDELSKKLIQMVEPLNAEADETRHRLLKQREELSQRLVQVGVRQATLKIVPDPLLWLTEGTPEAISKHLAEQQHLVMSGSEGDLVDVFAGQYQARGTAKLGPLLSAYSGESYSEGRMDSVREVRNPRLSVMLTIQPSVIEKMREQPEFASRGLTPRFLFSAPRSLVGSRTWEMTARIDREARTTYVQLIGQLLGVDLSGADDFDDPMAEQLAANADLDEDGDESPEAVGAVIEPTACQLKLSPEGREEYLHFRRAVEPRLIDEKDGLSGFAAWGNKLPGQMLRIAAVLHLMEHAEAGRRAWEIDVAPDTVRRAIRIAEYFRTHMVRLFVEMPQVAEGIVLDWLRTRNVSELDPRELYRSKRRQFDEKMSVLSETLDNLVELGWLRPHHPASSGGRPPRRYLVTPYLWDQEHDGGDAPGDAAA